MGYVTACYVHCLAPGISTISYKLTVLQSCPMSTDLVGSKLDKIDAKYPDKAAFIFRRGSKWDTLSYNQLFEHSNQLASGFQNM